MVASSAFDYKFKKKDMTIIIKTNASFNIEDSVVEDDPRLFFQRLFSLNQQNSTILSIMSFASCSLFDKKDLMTEALSELKNALLD